jgi:hypothetical protein
MAKKKAKKTSNKNTFTKEEIEELMKGDDTYDAIATESEVVSSEEAKAKAIVSLTESKDPEVLTQLEDNEIKALSTLSTIASLYSISFLDKWIGKFIRLRISLKRKGREEVVEIAKASGEQGTLGFSLNKFRK